MDCKYTKYEIARIIGCRATQIAGGAPPAVDIGDLDDAVAIAMKEWDEGKIPLTLIRKYPNGKEVTVDLAANNEDE